MRAAVEEPGADVVVEEGDGDVEAVVVPSAAALPSGASGSSASTSPKSTPTVRNAADDRASATPRRDGFPARCAASDLSWRIATTPWGTPTANVTRAITASTDTTAN